MPTCFSGLQVRVRPFLSDLINTLQGFLLWSLTLMSMLSIPRSALAELASDRDFSYAFNQVAMTIQGILLLLPACIFLGLLVNWARMGSVPSENQLFVQSSVGTEYY